MRRLNAIIFLLCAALCVAQSAFAASATDNFNRTNGTLGSNWMNINWSDFGNTQSGSIQVSTNAAIGTSAFYNFSVRTDIWPSDQSSEARLTNLTSFGGVIVRGSVNGLYVFFTDGTATGNWLRKVTPASCSNTSTCSTGVNETDIAANLNVGSAWTAGDLVKLQAAGTTLSIYRNGVLLTSFTDTTLTSGAPGIMTWNTTQILDDWTGVAATITSASTATSWVSSSDLINPTAASTQTTPVFNSTGASALVVWVSSHPVWPVTGGSAVTVSSITDSKSNQFVRLDGPVDITGTSATLRGWIYYCASPAVGTGHTVSVTFSTAAPVVIHAVAVSGTDAAAPILAYSGISGGTTSTSMLSSSISAPTQSLLLGFMKVDNTCATGCFNGALDGFTQDGNFDNFGVEQFQQVATSGNYAAHFTTSTPLSYEIALVAIGRVGSGVSIKDPIHGPLVVSASPNFFKTPSGKVVVMAGTQTWRTEQDISESSTPEAFDFDGYVSFLKSHGHNTTILWHKDLPTYCAWGADGTSGASGSTTWHISSQGFPWKRTGPGNADDGLLKFDLNSVNQDFYDRLRDRVWKLERNNIFAIVEFFDGLGLVSNRCAADGYPFTGTNNINTIDDGGGSGSMTMVATNAITAAQEAYVKRVIDTLNDAPNVIWEISEEAPGGSGTWWSGFIIDLVHKYEQGGTLSQTGEVFGAKAHSHPVLYPTLQPLNDDTGLANSNADLIAPAARTASTSYSGTGTPATKVAINDSDHSYFGMWNDSQQTNRTFVWENFANGNGVLYMDAYDIWWPTGGRNNCNGGTRPTNAVCSTIVSSAGWQENIRNNLGYIVTYGNKMNLALATPHSSLSSTTFCLANNVASGSEFLIYDATNAAFTVNLSAQNGKVLKVEWFDPATGLTWPGSNYTATSSTTQSFTPDTHIATDAVLYLVDINGHK